MLGLKNEITQLRITTTTTKKLLHGKQNSQSGNKVTRK